MFSKLKDIQRDAEYDVASNSAIPEDRLADYKKKITSALNESLADWIKDKRNT